MKELLLHNLGWKLLSVAIAIGLWFAIAREPELATSLSAPVEFKNIPEDLAIGSNVPDRIHVEVRGPSGRLSRDNLADVAMVLDLSDAHAGERTYTIHPNNLALPAGVTFYRAVPSQVTLRFERLMVRDVSVAPVFSKMSEGYRVRGYVVEPAKARIRGPEERVKNIAMVATDPVDLSGVVSEKEFHTHINVADPQVRLEAAGVVTLKVTLEKSGPKESK